MKLAPALLPARLDVARLQLGTRASPLDVRRELELVRRPISSNPSGKRSIHLARASSARSSGTRDRDAVQRKALFSLSKKPSSFLYVSSRREALELLEQLPLLLAEATRHGDVHEHALVAAAEALQHRHAAPAEHAHLAGLRARRELDLDRALERLDAHLRADRGLDDVQVDGREDVVALAHESRIRLDVHADVDVARAAAERAGMALAADPDLLAVVDARRDRDVEPALGDLPAAAFALGARRRRRDGLCRCTAGTSTCGRTRRRRCGTPAARDRRRRTSGT